MNDPVRGCDVYKNIGCTHVDGYLCDYPSCSILKDYRMNERIKSLLAQAHLDVMENLGDIDTNAVAERFAELIVLECADIADNADATREKWQSIGKFVKEHFGVEE